MQEKYRLSTRTVVILTLMTLPGTGYAGSYGESAVRDASVTNSASNTKGTVPCPRLNRRVSQSLAAQMDCTIGVAKPAVAGARTSNNPIANFFARHPNEARSGSVFDGDRGSQNRSSTSRVATEPNPAPPSNDSDSGRRSKWDRLGDLGITRENYKDQSDDIKSQIHDFRQGNPSDVDWSDFDPT